MSMQDIDLDQLRTRIYAYVPSLV